MIAAVGDIAGLASRQLELLGLMGELTPAPCVMGGCSSMTTAQLNELDSPEATQVLRWRLRNLLEARYRYTDALMLAMDGDVDLHAATDLMRRGCPSAPGVRILL